MITPNARNILAVCRSASASVTFNMLPDRATASVDLAACGDRRNEQVLADVYASCGRHDMPLPRSITTRVVAWDVESI